MNEIDILYLHPFCEKTDDYFILPVGIPALMNLLKKKGYKVRGVNLGLEKYLHKKRFNLNKILFENPAKIYAIDLHWYLHLFSGIKLIKYLKTINPSSIIILGGYTASGFAPQIMKIAPQVDFIIKGDGEIPLLKLLDNIFSQSIDLKDIPNLCYQERGNFKENKLSYYTDDLNNFDFINFDFLKNAKIYLHTKIPGIDPHYFSLCTGRGCPYNCIFCEGSTSSQKFISGRNKSYLSEKGRGKVIKRNPQGVFEDIKTLYQKEKINVFKPTQDISELGEEFYQPLLQNLRQMKGKVGLINECWGLPNKEFVSEFAQSVDKENSSLIITLLSGNEDIRKSSGKLFTNQDFYKFVRLSSKYSLKIEMAFSPYLPGENKKTFQETLNMIKKVQKYYPSSLLLYYSIPILPDPFSSLNLERDRFNIKGAPLNFYYYYDYSRKRNKYISYLQNKGFINLGYQQNSISPWSLQIKWWKEIFIQGVKRYVKNIYSH